MGGATSNETYICEQQLCTITTKEIKNVGKDVAGTLLKRDSQGISTYGINGVIENEIKTLTKKAYIDKRVYDKQDISPTLNTEGGKIVHIAVNNRTKKGYDVAGVGDSINLAFPESKTRRGRVGKGVAQTLDTSCNIGVLDNCRVRRLTPKECMRLQGVDDSVTDKLIAAGISSRQLYRSAGDAMTVNVLYEIAKNMKIYP